MTCLHIRSAFYLVCVIGTFFAHVHAFPDKGKWAFTVDGEKQFVGISKSLYANSSITLKVQCPNGRINVLISWVLRHSPCGEEYAQLENTDDKSDILRRYHKYPGEIPVNLNYSLREYIKTEEYEEVCSDSPIILPEVNRLMDKRVSRDVKTEHPQYIVRKEGLYLFVVHVQPNPKYQENITFQAVVKVEMKSDTGYLSVADWPLLPFYATMCGLYTILGLFWLLICFCRWKDILRIQIWIGAVLFLGMLEMAVYLAEYESLNKTGELTEAAYYFAELLSCAKRSLARILVLIASMGFGIVKPRLGAMLQRIVGVGVIYMVLSSVETHMELVQPKNDTSREIAAALFLLALLDAGISFWIFSSLVQTTRTLRLRRNAVKLSLYYHFTNTLAFAVVASVIFMIWSIYFHKMVSCLTDWKELWLDEAFWKLLFSLLLIVIMILWRPTNNNQIYAFTPLLDSGDEHDEEDEIVVNDNLEGMKMRTTRTSNSSPSPRARDGATNSIEDELKWVEENIPSSLVESGLPLLDSEEEIMTTRFELSKMQ